MKNSTTASQATAAQELGTAFDATSATSAAPNTDNLAVSRKLIRAGRYRALSVFFAVCMVLACASGYAFAAAASNEPNVVVQDANIVSYGGIDGVPSASVESSDYIAIDAGTLTIPGAYVEIEATVSNTGNADATLVSMLTTDLSNAEIINDMSIDFPSIPEGEVLAAGDTCTFSMVLSWDASSTAEYETLVADTFGVVLTYENDSESGTGAGLLASTGDTMAGVCWIIALVAVMGLLACIVAYRRAKREQG